MAVKKVVAIIGKVCTGKSTLAKNKYPDFVYIEVADIVRRLAKQVNRSYNKTLDQSIIAELRQRIIESQDKDVVIVGIRQLSIYKNLLVFVSGRSYNLMTYRTIADMETIRCRFNARNAEKDSMLEYTDVIRKDAELGLAKLEEFISGIPDTIIINTTQTDKMLQKLFKRASNGKIQEWTIETLGDSFRTSEGYQGGKITPTAWTDCEPKNVGRANATTGEEQAVKEAEARVVKQKKNGWTDDINNIDLDSVQVIKPMLAKQYQDEIERLYQSGDDIALQPKLDGIRAYTDKDRMGTKEGGTHSIVSAHIHDVVKDLLDGCIDNTILDGELYNHIYKADFNKISSIVRTQNPTAEEISDAREVLEYHLYDINIPNKTFAERHSILKALVELIDNPIIQLVETVFLNVRNNSTKAIQDRLDLYHKKWVNEGYEGSMIRNANSLYQPKKRTRDLLKRKDFVDEEFILVDILAGKGNKATMAASVTCRDKRGEEFDAGILGDNSYCANLLFNKDQYIGKQVTIKYQNLTPDRKVPRFGKMKAIRDYE